MSAISFIVSLHYMFPPQTGHHQVLSDNIMDWTFFQNIVGEHLMMACLGPKHVVQ
jgi:hypothetical protein